LNDLAWILATAPDDRLRNGAEAVTLAERACHVSDFEEAQFIGTLAAAYAEAGRFENAIRAGEKAKAMAAAAGQKELVEKNRQLLELYRAGKPYRDAAAPNK
jgi:Flp pilus assembly protein TadD